MRNRLPRNSVTPVTLPHVRKYYVYRLIDAKGDTLYIGRSQDPIARLRAHLGWNGATCTQGSESWPARVAQVDAWGPYTWDQVVKLEADAIATYRPPHNKAGLVRQVRPVSA